jgi:hypothetical protein
MDANIKFFDNLGNAAGSAASLLRSAAEMLEINREIGSVNIFGATETAESVAGQITLVRSRAADLIDKVSTALRSA